MADLLIRDLDPAVHQELKRRADEAHVSSGVCVDVLGQHAGRPTVAQWLRSLEQFPRHPEVSGADVMRDVRKDLIDARARRVGGHRPCWCAATAASESGSR